MWRWQLNEFNVSYRFRFFIQLLLVSAVAHCGFFTIATITYRVMGQKIFHIQIHAKLSDNGARIVFKPFVQSVQQKQAVQNTRKVISKKIVRKQNAKSKIKHTKTALQTRKKKPIKKVVHKKVLTKSVAKKIVAQKPKQQIASPKKSIQYVNQKELETLHLQTKIQQLIYKLWKPPIGLSKELACTISVTVDASGYITATTISKPSGVLIYDIAARSAVTQLAIPSVACNQSFSITFKQ